MHYLPARLYMGGNHGEVVKVSDPVARIALAVIVALCSFGASQIWKYNETLTKHTSQIETLQENETKLEQQIYHRLDRIEVKQEKLFEELRKRP